MCIKGKIQLGWNTGIHFKSSKGASGGEMDGWLGVVVHLFYGLWLISNQVRLMFHKSNILGLSHILWRTTSIHMSSHLLDETLVWHNSEQGIWSAMQSSTSSIIMENKQRHGIWSLLKALFSLCYYLCSSSNEVLWGCMKWFSLKLMVAYLHSKLLALFFFILHEVAILLNAGQYLDYSGLYFQIVGCLLMNIAYWQMIPSLFSEWGVNPFISTN